MLTPADIENAQFKAVRLKEGYDQEEVDAFLDRVAEDYKFLTAQVARMDEENRTLRRQAERLSTAPTAQIPPIVVEPTPPTPSALAEKLLAAAELAARQHEAEAQEKADEIVRKAGGEGARIVEEATEAAERIKSDGLAEKYRRNEELEAKINKATQTLNSLDQRGNQMRRALADMINSYDTEFPR